MPHVGDKIGYRWKDIVKSCPKTCRSLVESNAHVPEQPSFEIGQRGAGCYLASCTVHTSAATESFRLQPLSTRSTPARHFALLSLKYLLCFILRQPKPRPRPHSHNHAHTATATAPQQRSWFADSINHKSKHKRQGGGGKRDKQRTRFSEVLHKLAEVVGYRVRFTKHKTCLHAVDSRSDGSPAKQRNERQSKAGMESTK